MRALSIGWQSLALMSVFIRLRAENPLSQYGRKKNYIMICSWFNEKTLTSSGHRDCEGKLCQGAHVGILIPDPDKLAHHVLGRWLGVHPPHPVLQALKLWLCSEDQRLFQVMQICSNWMPIYETCSIALTGRWRRTFARSDQRWCLASHSSMQDEAKKVPGCLWSNWRTHLRECGCRKASWRK